MNVLLIHQYVVNPDQPGGTRHLEFGARLVAAGHHYTMVAGDLDYQTGRRLTDDPHWIVEEEVQGVRILRSYCYPSLHRNFLWRVVTFISFMFTSIWAAMRCGPVDIVVGTSPPLFQLFSAWFTSVIRRRPLLIEIRDLWPDFAVDMGVLKNPLLIWLARRMELFFYRQATHLLVNSPAYRDHLLSKGAPDEKITVIPNGVAPEMFDPSDDGAELRRAWDLEDKFIVTYAGALGPANDIFTILRAAERLCEMPEVHFVLVGDGKDRTALEQFAADRRLTNVTFAGSYPKNQMRQVLAASNACVATLKDIPMFRTTYPNKVFDYMAAGRPTVLAIDGVIRQVVEAGEAGICVAPENDAAMADAVRTLCASPDLCAAMGRSGRAYVERHFNRAEHAREFAQLLARLTGADTPVSLPAATP